MVTRVGFKYIFVFEYRHLLCLIFGLYLKSICKYSQIHVTILPTKGTAMPDIYWLRSLVRMFLMPVSRQH